MKAPRIRILHTVFSLEPGGLENGIVNVANALDPDRFEVSVCCLERRGLFADRLRASVGVAVLDKKPGLSVVTCARLMREIRRGRPHLIHSHNLGPLIYSAAATFGGLTVPILHGEHAELHGRELRPFYLRLRHRLYRCCRAVHSVGLGLDGQLAELKLACGKRRVVVNGVDTARFSPVDERERQAIRARIGLPENATVAGIVGRFGPFKGHAALIDAFERVADREPTVRLLVVGTGGPREIAVREQATASRHASRIHLAGYQRDPLCYYRAMDLLAVPSVNEGLSNAVLEAMACGVSVLGSRTCGNGDVIDSGLDGFLADLSSPAAIETALCAVFADKGRLRKVGAAARQKIVADYSLARMVREYETIYLETARVR